MGRYGGIKDDEIANKPTIKGRLVELLDNLIGQAIDTSFGLKL